MFFISVKFVKGIINYCLKDIFNNINNKSGCEFLIIKMKMYEVIGFKVLGIAIDLLFIREVYFVTTRSISSSLK